MQNLFELANVTKRYKQVTALNGFTIEMPPGAIGLLGPNGAGKTTMIRTLLGLIRIDEGEGAVLGLDIRKQRLAIRQLVGFMPEDECLFPSVDGVEFVAYAGELAGLPTKAAMQRAHEVLNYVELGEERYRPVDSYSTGMKQRVKLAAALVHDPKLLILDEPTNGMDPKGREDMLGLARDLAHNKGVSLLFASHLLPDVESVCDQVMVIGKGRLLAKGKIADLKANHESVFEIRLKAEPEPFLQRLRDHGIDAQIREDLIEVRLGAGANVAPLWSLAQQANEQIRYLRPKRSSLEEVFLKAVAEQI